MRPNNLIISSDFGSTKNDTSGNVISFTVPNNYVYNPSTNPIFGTVTMQAGSKSSGLRAIGTSSKYGVLVPGNTIYSDIDVDIPSLGSPILTSGLYCVLDRIEPEIIRLRVGTDGGGGAQPDYRTREPQTITFWFSTFLSPFDN